MVGLNAHVMSHVSKRGSNDQTAQWKLGHTTDRNVSVSVFEYVLFVVCLHAFERVCACLYLYLCVCVLVRECVLIYWCLYTFLDSVCIIRQWLVSPG